MAFGLFTAAVISSLALQADSPAQEAATAGVDAVRRQCFMPDLLPVCLACSIPWTPRSQRARDDASQHACRQGVTQQQKVIMAYVPAHLLAIGALELLMLNPVCMLHYCEVIVLSTSFLCSSWRSGCHACC